MNTKAKTGGPAEGAVMDNDCFFDEPLIDDDFWKDECGMTDEGLCMYAGSEWCDFECPRNIP